VQIRRRDRGNTWSCDAGAASMAAANRGNGGPRDTHPASCSSTPWSDSCATGARLLVGGQDKLVGMGACGSGPWVAARPSGMKGCAHGARCERESLSRHVLKRPVRFSHCGSIWRFRDQQNTKLRVEPLTSFMAQQLLILPAIAAGQRHRASCLKADSLVTSQSFCNDSLCNESNKVVSAFAPY
jgi:hypothetical protein